MSRKTPDRRSTGVTRRRMLAGGAALALGARDGASARTPRVVEKGRLRHSVCKWCYRDLSLEELCAAAAAMGLSSVELLGPESYPVVKSFGLACAVTNSHSLTRGLANPAYHDECLRALEGSIDAAAREGFPNVITFSGNRQGIPDDVGLENCARALENVVGRAEKKGVTIVLELLNSKVDHPDYMADNTPWGLELVDRVSSERFKLLYDIYHMQIMEGDVIRTIRSYAEYFGHYHTGGNPGRHELDEKQELQYGAIARAIAETGYRGYLGQEFIPTRDPLESLAAAVRLCDV